MRRSHLFKNHSNELHFQIPSNHRGLSMCLATPPKFNQKFKNFSHAAIVSNRWHAENKPPNYYCLYLSHCPSFDPHCTPLSPLSPTKWSPAYP